MHDKPSIELLEEMTPDELQKHLDQEICSGISPDPNRLKYILQLFGGDIPKNFGHIYIKVPKFRTTYHHILTEYDDLNKYIISMLVEHGLHLEIRNSINYTPLHNAVYSRKIKSVKILLELGAEVNAINISGNTSLHLICSHLIWKPDDDIKGILNILLHAGGDLHIKNYHNISPHDILMRNNVEDTLNQEFLGFIPGVLHTQTSLETPIQ